MKEITYISISNAKEVLEKHPKFKESLRQWQIEKAIQGGAPKDIAEAQISEHFLEIVLMASPRSVLYDFFDENNIYISIIYTDNWSYTISYKDGNIFHGDGEGRKDVEIKAFLKAIEIFENENNS